MELTLTYTGKVENGQIFGPQTKKRFQQEVTKVFEGKQIVVTVERKRRKRSPEQNKYYWGVVLVIIAHELKELNPELEVTKDDAHEFCKRRFLPMVTDWEDFRLNTPEGSEIEIRKTTTRLSTSQFMDYVALIQQFAAEYGWYIPDPDEFEFESVEAVDVDSR